MRASLLGLLLAPAFAVAVVQAAEFTCQEDVKPPHYTAEEQALVDTFWNETVLYLDAYLDVLKKPTGQCQDSAEATIQTYRSETGKKQIGRAHV